MLQNRLESTHVTRLVFSHVGFPAGATDPIVRQVQDQGAEVVLVDLDPANPQRAIHAIELIRATTSEIAIFAAGEMRNPMHIVAAMRAGASEFLDRAAGVDALLEAFNRFSISRSRQLVASFSGNCRITTS